MKKILLRTAICFTTLFIIAALGSCKKSANNNTDNNTDKPVLWNIIYRKATAGVNELWSIDIYGANDHKMNIPLPAGWKLLDENVAEIYSPRIYVLAYNAALNQNAIFVCYTNGTELKQVLNTSGAEDLGLLGALPVNTTPILIYWRHNANKELELWQMNLDGTDNHKFNVMLPANTYLADDQQVATLYGQHSYIFLATRFEDAVTHKTTYPIYRCDSDGSNLLLISEGETDSAPALQAAKYAGVLYHISNTDTSANELWYINIDGTDKHAIRLVLPSGTKLQDKEMVKLSDDGKTIIFLTTNANGQAAIYTANIDGSNVKLLKQFATGQDIAIQYYLQQYYL